MLRVVLPMQPLKLLDVLVPSYFTLHTMLTKLVWVFFRKPSQFPTVYSSRRPDECSQTTKRSKSQLFPKTRFRSFKPSFKTEYFGHALQVGGFGWQLWWWSTYSCVFNLSASSSTSPQLSLPFVLSALVFWLFTRTQPAKI